MLTSPTVNLGTLFMRLGAHPIAIAPDRHFSLAMSADVPNVSVELLGKLNALVGGEPGPISAALPKTWDDPAPGHLIIAQDSAADGWFEAVVLKRDGDSVTLRWRDYPSQPEFIRLTTAVALLKHD